MICTRSTDLALPLKHNQNHKLNPNYVLLFQGFRNTQVRTAHEHHACPASASSERGLAWKRPEQAQRTAVNTGGWRCGCNQRKQFTLAIYEWTSRPLSETSLLLTRTLTAGLCPQKCLWFWRFPLRVANLSDPLENAWIMNTATALVE